MAAKTGSIESYQDGRGEWRWRMRDAGGVILGAACEGYPANADCEANARRGRRARDEWESYEDRTGNWRWRRTASNGRIVGAAQVGCGSKNAAQENAAVQGYAL